MKVLHSVVNTVRARCVDSSRAQAVKFVVMRLLHRKCIRLAVLLTAVYLLANGKYFFPERPQRASGLSSVSLASIQVPLDETSGRDEVSRLSFDVPIDDQVVVVTYSDRISEGLCRSMTSAAVHGFELRVFGLDAATSFAEFKGDPKKKKVLGMEKLFGNQTMQKQLGLHNESIIIFADAADVIYLDTLDKVKKRYFAISSEHGENSVLFAAERNCWPYMAGKQQRIPGGKAECAVFPDRNSTFRYLNSGAYIGKFRAIKAMLAAASEGLGATHADDQLTFHQLFSRQLQEGAHVLDETGFTIVLDYKADLFQTGWGTNLESERFAEHDDSGAYYDTRSKQVINTEHGSTPFLVHFNGGKTALQPVANSVLTEAATSVAKSEQGRSILSKYRDHSSWFTGRCASMEDIALLYNAAGLSLRPKLMSTESSSVHLKTTDSELSMSPDQRRSKRQTDVSAELGFNHTHIPCPPGYPHKPDNPHTKACVLQFFWSAIHDIEVLADDKALIVSISKMSKIVSKWPQRLGLFVLSRDIDTTGLARWNHVSGQGKTFWSTKPFHQFMSRHAETFSSSLSPGQKAYFVINGFDEPAVIGECPDFTSLTQQHPNAKFRLIDSTESVPVWSMSKIRGCHADLLIPNPDIFAKFARESEAKSHHLPWIQRADKVVFRGSSTGMGTSDSNLRVRVSRELFNHSDFDVGIHAAVQSIQEDSIRSLMKPKLHISEWSKYKYAMDIDGNAHSFNRPLAIARAGCTLLRVNIFTDLFDDGLLSEVHAFDIDPAYIVTDAYQVLHKLRESPNRAEASAKLLYEVHEWMTEAVLVEYMRKAIATYVRAVNFL